MLTNSKYILVVGGAGFIGSHMVLNLQRAGYVPVVFDNLSKGHRDAVIGAELIVGDMVNSLNLTMYANHPAIQTVNISIARVSKESAREYSFNKPLGSIMFMISYAD